MATTLDLSDENAQFRSRFNDPLGSCYYLTRAAQEYTASEFCRLEVFSRSAVLFSVTFEENGAVQMRSLSPGSCAARWLRASEEFYHFVENDASTLNQPLPQEWAAFRTRLSSFLSFRMRVPGSAQRIWGTLTLACRKAHHFSQQQSGIRQTFKLMDAFMKNAHTTFLTDVCQTVYDMKCSESWNASMDVLSRFYRRHAPVISVSVAVGHPPANHASMFVEREASLGAEKRSMECLPLRADETTLFAQIRTSRRRQPVEVKVPFAASVASGQTLQSDLKNVMSKQHWSSAFFVGLPLRKPAGRSFSEFSVVPAHDDGDGFVGVVYLHMRSGRAFHEVRTRIHSLSPIFASILHLKLPLIRERSNHLLIQDLPSPMNLEHQTAESTESTQSTEMTARIKDVIKATNQHKRAEDRRRQTHPLGYLQIRALLSRESANGVILEGTNMDKMVVIKVLSARRAGALNANPARVRLEFVVANCVDHRNVIKSRAQHIGISGEQLVRNLPACTCHINGQRECQHCQIMSVLGCRAFPQTVADSLWDVMVTDFCDGGSLRTLIYTRRAFCNPQDRSLPNMRSLLLTLLEMAEAMEYLHEHGIVHGDFKPENVLAVKKARTATDPRDWSVKVADFGTSRVLGYNDRRIPDTTPAYRAPEFMGTQQSLMESHSDGMAGDVYSFGMTWWEMMEARLPFGQFRTPAELQQMARQGYRPELHVQCPPDCRRLQEKCWHQSPNQRPSFSSIVREIQSMLRSLPI